MTRFRKKNRLRVSASHPAKSVVTNPVATIPQPRKNENAFTGEDFNHLADEHYYLTHNSNRVAHAVITHETNGDVLAYQYRLPAGTKKNTPVVCQLTHLEEIKRCGKIYHRAKGPDGKKWYARRYDHARLKLDNADEIPVDIGYFSEEDEPGKEPDWGRNKRIKRFRNPPDDTIQPLVKGGYDMVVDAESIHHRETEHTRKPDQHDIMGESARDAYERFFRNKDDVLSPQFIELLQRAFTPDHTIDPQSHFWPQWLHAYGHRLTPVTENPQKKSNLGAAGQWVNIEMMVLERIAEWFAVHQRATTTVSLNSLFTMLNDSELIDKIHSFHTRSGCFSKIPCIS